MPPPHDVRIDPHPPIAIDTYLQAEFPPSTTAPTSSSSLEQPDSLLCRRRGTAISGGCERRDTKRVVSKSSFSAETSTVRRVLNTRHDKYPDLTTTRLSESHSTYLLQEVKFVTGEPTLAESRTFSGGLNRPPSPTPTTVALRASMTAHNQAVSTQILAHTDLFSRSSWPSSRRSGAANLAASGWLLAFLLRLESRPQD